ncbi:MAG: helix-turn-helix domain-containing protein [Desulfurococcaceae archaeon TW002]
MHVEIRKSSRSFFGKLSEYGRTKINLEVIKVSDSPLYLVFGYLPSNDLSGEDLRKYRYLLTKSTNYIKKLRWWNDGKLTYILAYKTKCDFMRVAEENKVSVLSPYIFDKGIRKYVVVGRKENLIKYIEYLMKLYASEHVYYKPINRPEYLCSVLVSRAVPSVITDKLTMSELNVLKSAYDTGFFECPRKTDLNKLSELLGLSKVTIDIHLRKAVKKIVDEVLNSCLNKF